MRAYRWLVPCSALLLAACGGDSASSSPAPVAAPTTVSALAVAVIDTETCDTRSADIINGRIFNNDQNTTDVSTLKPGCTVQ